MSAFNYQHKPTFGTSQVIKHNKNVVSQRQQFSHSQRHNTVNNNYRSPTPTNPISVQYTGENSQSYSKHSFQPQAQSRNIEYSDNVSITTSHSRNPLRVKFGDSQNQILNSPYNGSRQLKSMRGGGSISNISTSHNNQISKSIDRKIQPRRFNYNHTNNFSNSQKKTHRSTGYPGYSNTVFLNKQNRKDIKNNMQLLRAKNQAIPKLIKNLFEDFLKKLGEMRGLVRQNLYRQFQTRLNEIWLNYLKEQKMKKNLVHEKDLWNHLKQIETFVTEFLILKTDVLFHEMQVTYLDQIKNRITKNQHTHTGDSLGPLRIRAEQANKDCINAERRHFQQQFEEKEKYRLRRRKHIESYNREFRIKFSSDKVMAKDHLYNALNYYKKNINKMEKEIRQGPFQEMMTLKQKDHIDNLRRMIEQFRR